MPSIQEDVKGRSELTSELPLFPLTKIVAIALLHIGVGVAIVAISGFTNSEMKLLGWTDAAISIILGIAILFELFRLYFGYLHDRNGKTVKYLVLGVFLSSVGLAFIPVVISSFSAIWLLLPVASFYVGTAILTTLVDAYLTKSTSYRQRSQIAGVIQSLRLIGFAVGGVFGGFLFRIFPYSVFMAIIMMILIITSGVSILAIIAFNRKSAPVTVSNQTKSFLMSLSELKIVLTNPLPALMSVFLVLFSIGLFMQDLILEPFTIETLGFAKEGVGRVVALWSLTTLVFVPIGALLEKNVGRRRIIVTGELSAGLGLVIISAVTAVPNEGVFWIGLVLFGAGSGLFSAPAISLMLDVCALKNAHLTLMLGFYGILITFGRSLSPVVAGVILILSGNKYFVVFIVEALAMLLSLIPLMLLTKVDYPTLFAKMDSESLPSWSSRSPQKIFRSGQQKTS